MNDGRGDGAGCFDIKEWADTTELTNVEGFTPASNVYLNESVIPRVVPLSKTGATGPCNLCQQKIGMIS